MASQFALTSDRKRRIEESRKRSAEAEEDYDPKAKAAPDRAVKVEPKGTLSQYDIGNQTIRERVASIPRAIATDVFGVNPTRANRFGEDAASLIDFVPGVGDAIGAAETVEAAKQGDWKSAGINAAGTALGVVPVVGDIAAKGIKQLAKKEAKTALKGTQKIAAKVAKPKATQFALPSEKVVKSDLSLRDMTREQAIAKARTEPHLRPDPKTGKIVGAPEQVTSKADVERIRKEFDVKLGRGAKSADWYMRAQDFVRKYAGPNPKAQDELAANLGLMSPRANPDVNLSRSVMVRNAAITGEPATSGAFPDQLKKYNTQFADVGGAQLPSGMKVSPYASYLSPNQYDPTTAVNDTWHGSNLGFRMRPDPEAGLKPENLGAPQHSYMDYETMLATDRANQRKLLGREDWTAGETQAAPWVDAKARDLMDRLGWDEKRAYDEAHKSYGEYAPKYEFQGTGEIVPGKETGHRPDVTFGGQEARDTYSRAQPGGGWGDPQGRDIIYGGQGAYVGPSHEMIGRFEGDTNVGNVATPLVSFTNDPATGGRVLDKGSEQLVRGSEAARGYFDVQDAAAGSIPIKQPTVGLQTGYELGGIPFSAESMNELGGLRDDLGDIVHYGGDRGLLTNFGPRNEANFGAQAQRDILADIQARYPGATAKPVGVGSTYTDYTDAWRGGAQPGEAAIQGSDQATNVMLSNLTDVQAQRMDTDAMRQAVRRKFDIDEAAAAQGATVRQDVQTARKIFSTEGFEGLKAALGKGILPAAAIGVFMNEMMPGGQEQPQGGQL